LALLLMLLIMVLLPLLGAGIAGLPFSLIFEFPPRTLYVRHAPFSPAVFSLYAAFVILSCGPFVWRWMAAPRVPSLSGRQLAFPAWGWAGLAICAAGWLTAWKIWQSQGSLAEYAFFALWCGYIILMNALCVSRNGSSPLVRAPRSYLLLFPVSAAFWWFFEYLNRFVQNWSYQNVAHYSAQHYFWLATLSFSTVLPAVFVTREFLTGFDGLGKAFEKFQVPPLFGREEAACLIVLGICAVLLLLPAYPDVFFPALWVCPPLLLHGVQMIRQERSYLSPFFSGNPRPAVEWALTGLFCGFFWEMWNSLSAAKWIYHVPYVDSFRLFEMPLLGYAGYLPFGVFCGGILGLYSERFRG